MRESLSRRPWHASLDQFIARECGSFIHLREHHMQWDTQLLRTVDVSKAGRIGNDGVRHERSRAVYDLFVIRILP